MLSVQKELNNRSLYEFLVYFWQEVEGNEYQDAPYIELLCTEVQHVLEQAGDFANQKNGYDLIVNVPPGTSKSSIVSKFGMAWLWTKYPKTVVISSSYSAFPVRDFTRKFVRLLESDRFRAMYPELTLKEDNVTVQENTMGGIRYTTSTGASITAVHANLIICDDPNKPPRLVRDSQGQPKLEEGARITEILSANSWHDDVLSTRKVDKEKTRTIYVQQRVHESDLTGFMLKKATEGKRIRHIVLPATIEQQDDAYIIDYNNQKGIKKTPLGYLYTNGLLDPNRMANKVLQDIKITMGSHVYNAQFLQNPLPDRGGIVKPEYFPIVNSSEVPDNLVRFFYSDTSEGKKTSDNMATAVFSLWDGKLLLWEVYADKKPFPEFIGARDESGNYVPQAYDKLVVWHKGNYQSRHFFEAKSTGTPYIQYMQKHTSYNVIADIPHGSKMDRVQLALPQIMAGKVLLVTGSAMNQFWIDEFLAECRSFTGKDGERDDRVDVLSAIVRLTDFSGSIYQVEKESSITVDPQDYSF